MLAMTDTTQKWQPFTWIGMGLLSYLVLLSLVNTFSELGKKRSVEEYISDVSYF